MNVEIFNMYILLMIFIQVGAIISSITFDNTIFIINSVISVVGFVIYIYFSIKKRELKPKK